MRKPDGESLKFRLFVATYLRDYPNTRLPTDGVITEEEMDNVRKGLDLWYAQGQKVIAAIAPGLEAAAIALMHRQQREAVEVDDPQCLIEYMRGTELVIVPIWYHYYPEAKTAVSAYLAAIGQPPL